MQAEEHPAGIEEFGGTIPSKGGHRRAKIKRHIPARARAREDLNIDAPGNTHMYRSLTTAIGLP
jgi:hypothetical protein